MSTLNVSAVAAAYATYLIPDRVYDWQLCTCNADSKNMDRLHDRMMVCGHFTKCSAPSCKSLCMEHFVLCEKKGQDYRAVCNHLSCLRDIFNELIQPRRSTRFLDATIEKSLVPPLFVPSEIKTPASADGKTQVLQATRPASLVDTDVSALSMHEVCVLINDFPKKALSQNIPFAPCQDTLKRLLDPPAVSLCSIEYCTEPCFTKTFDIGSQNKCKGISTKYCIRHVCCAQECDQPIDSHFLERSDLSEDFRYCARHMSTDYLFEDTPKCETRFLSTKCDVYDRRGTNCGAHYRCSNHFDIAARTAQCKDAREPICTKSINKNEDHHLTIMHGDFTILDTSRFGHHEHGGQERVEKKQLLRKRSRLQALPSVLLATICSFLDLDTRFQSIPLVCKALHRACIEHSWSVPKTLRVNNRWSEQRHEDALSALSVFAFDKIQCEIWPLILLSDTPAGDRISKMKCQELDLSLDTSSIWLDNGQLARVIPHTHVKTCRLTTDVFTRLSGYQLLLSILPLFCELQTLELVTEQPLGFPFDDLLEHMPGLVSLECFVQSWTQVQAVFDNRKTLRHVRIRCRYEPFPLDRAEALIKHHPTLQTCSLSFASDADTEELALCLLRITQASPVTGTFSISPLE